MAHGRTILESIENRVPAAYMYMLTEETMNRMKKNKRTKKISDACSVEF